MQSIPDDPKAILDMAVANEIQGHQILEDAMKNTDDPRAKATFEFLADQEIEHIELIKEFAKSLEEGTAWTAPEFQELSQEEAGSRIRGIFERFQIQFEDAGILPDAHLEIYEVAMDMEKRGYDYYTAAAKRVSNKNAKQIFEFLAREEQRHFEIIQETHEFLSNPDSYLAWEERWMQT